MPCQRYIKCMHYFMIILNYNIIHSTGVIAFSPDLRLNSLFYVKEKRNEKGNTELIDNDYRGKNIWFFLIGTNDPEQEYKENIAHHSGRSSSFHRTFETYFRSSIEVRCQQWPLPPPRSYFSARCLFFHLSPSPQLLFLSSQYHLRLPDSPLTVPPLFLSLKRRLVPCSK